MSDGAGGNTQEWRILPEPGWYERAGAVPATGQYVQVTGRGRILGVATRSRGTQASWAS